MRMAAVSLITLLALFAGATGPAQDQAMPNRPAEDLPPGRMLVEQALAKLGEPEARAQVKSFSFNATMTRPAQMTMRVEAMRSFHIAISMPAPTGEGDMTMIRRDSIGWAQHPKQGLHLMKERDLIVFESIMGGQLLAMTLIDRFDTFQTIERTGFGGRPCWKVRATNADPKRQATVYFDAGTDEFAGREITIQSPAGVEGQLQFIVRDWKTVEDIRMIAAVGMASTGSEQKFEFRDFAFNQVEESIFDIPEEIQQQLDDQNSAEGDRDGDEDETSKVVDEDDGQTAEEGDADDTSDDATPVSLQIDGASDAFPETPV